MIGRRYGRLVVTSEAETRVTRKGHSIRCFNVRCDCGTEKVTPGYRMRNGNTLSCGCLMRETRGRTQREKPDGIIGRRFGRQIVVRRADERDKAGARQFVVRCDCGKEHVVRGYVLTRRGVQSCGCEAIKRHTSHGLAGSPEHKVWLGIIKRCENPNDKHFADYGGRGIRISSVWRRDFAAFLAEVGERPTPKHSIERIDNSRGYEPGNVRWATMQEQANNTRRNYTITIDGRTQTIAQWAHEKRVLPHLIIGRLRRGWDPVSAVTKPEQMSWTRKRRLHRLKASAASNLLQN